MKSDVPEILLEWGKAIRKMGLAVSYLLRHLMSVKVSFCNRACFGYR